jgi:hypothetical protein
LARGPGAAPGCLAHHDRETLDAYHLYQGKQKPAPQASFALQAQYFSWRAQGLRIGRTFDGPRIAGRPSTIELSGAVYGKQRLRERSVSGTLNYMQTDTYGFPRYTAAPLDYRDQDWSAGVQVVRYVDETIPTLSLSRRLGGLTLLGNVETRFKSAGIGLAAGNFRLMS